MINKKRSTINKKIKDKRNSTEKKKWMKNLKNFQNKWENIKKTKERDHKIQLINLIQRALIQIKVRELLKYRENH